MKKVLLIMIAVLVALSLGFGGYILYAYVSADEEAVAEPEVSFMGHAVEPDSVEWHTPVANGLLTKDFYMVIDRVPQDLGSFDVTELRLDAPAEGILTVKWLDEAANYGALENGQLVFTGSVSDYREYRYAENGDYQADLTIAQAPDTKDPWGTFTYRFYFSVDIPASIELSSTEALQGDIVTVLVDMGLEKGLPEIATGLGAPVFAATDGAEAPGAEAGDEAAGAGRYYAAYVPVNYNCKAGDWDISVTAGDLSETYTVTVSEREYAEQHMSMPQSTTDATMNNPKGPANWKERIQPLWETADTEKYWTETFMQPCDGRVSTRFGLYRYTNNNPTPRRHTGIDLAIEEGTPVAASNRGRVVLAEEIIYTGNTVVIEHGGGLKTYYFHMSQLDCAEGDMVEKGDIIGLVGSTGYSTGPHLHFEVKIGKTSLSPWELFDGSSGLYFE